MRSSVLKSDRAIEVNIQIMRVFIKLRQMVFAHDDLTKTQTYHGRMFIKKRLKSY